MPRWHSQAENCPRKRANSTGASASLTLPLRPKAVATQHKRVIAQGSRVLLETPRAQGPVLSPARGAAARGRQQGIDANGGDLNRHQPPKRDKGTRTPVMLRADLPIERVTVASFRLRTYTACTYLGFGSPHWRVGAVLPLVRWATWRTPDLPREALNTDPLGAWTNTPVSVAIAGGRIGLSNVLFAKARLETKYQDAEKATTCSPMEGSEALQECKELPLGPPSRSDSFVIAADGRFLGRRVALGASVGYDTQKREWAVDMPIYLRRDKEDRFTGGVRLKWQQGNEVLLNVFVATPLTFDPSGEPPRPTHRAQGPA